MKMNRLFIILIIGLFGLSQCKSDFTVTTTYKEIPVIWALLNHQDETHYIRIQKAFLDENTSALVIAQRPDSIYFADILDVTITESGTNNVFQLERIDGDTLPEPILKEVGDFSSSPNILYRLKGKLDEDRIYTIQIVNNETGKIISAETEMVHDFFVTRPFSNQKIEFVGPTNSFIVFWQLAVNGKIHDLTIRIHYSEAEADDPFVKTAVRYVDWPVFNNKNFTNPAPKYEIPGDVFYGAVRKLIAPENNRVRYLDSLDFTYSVGTEFLSDYVNYNQAQTGITQNQATIQFTNVENGIGLFTSRYYKTVEGVKLSNPSLDTLACGSVTGDLGFAPENNPNKYPNYPFCN